MGKSFLLFPLPNGTKSHKMANLRCSVAYRAPRKSSYYRVLRGAGEEFCPWMEETQDPTGATAILRASPGFVICYK
jgi:hypothetical protein